MRIEYDAKADTLYTHFNDNKVSKTQSVNDLVLVDLDADGHPVQIEILSASHYADVSELTYKFLAEALVNNS